MKPLISLEYACTRHIMNPKREYIPASHTDIRATFARIRAEQAQPVKAKKLRRVK
jgi:hypothetical protein